jgi:hypothetical protein
MFCLLPLLSNDHYICKCYSLWKFTENLGCTEIVDAIVVSHGKEKTRIQIEVIQRNGCANESIVG